MWINFEEDAYQWFEKCLRKWNLQFYNDFPVTYSSWNYLYITRKWSFSKSAAYPSDFIPFGFYLLYLCLFCYYLYAPACNELCMIFVSYSIIDTLRMESLNSRKTQRHLYDRFSRTIVSYLLHWETETRQRPSSFRSNFLKMHFSHATSSGRYLDKNVPFSRRILKKFKREFPRQEIAHVERKSWFRNSYDTSILPIH